MRGLACAGSSKYMGVFRRDDGTGPAERRSGGVSHNLGLEFPQQSVEFQQRRCRKLPKEIPLSLPQDQPGDQGLGQPSHAHGGNKSRSA